MALPLQEKKRLTVRQVFFRFLNQMKMEKFQLKTAQNTLFDPKWSALFYIGVINPFYLFRPFLRHF